MVRKNEKKTFYEEGKVRDKTRLSSGQQLRNVVNLLEFTWIYLNLLEFT